MAVFLNDDKATSSGDIHVEALDANDDRRCVRLIVAFAAAGARWTADEVLAEQAGSVSVVINAEHQLIGRFIYARPPPNHLVKANRTFEILEENDIAHTRHVNAGSQQIHCGSNKVATRRGAEIGELVVAATGRRTFERIGIPPLLAVGGAPVRIQVVHTSGHLVGVIIADAENDGLLLGAASGEEVLKQVAA